MSPFLQVLLSLFGAALLGNVIGWFARRIVALRDEKALIEQHQRQMSELQRDLVEEREDNKSLVNRVASLEARVLETDRLNETIEATEKELLEIRNESQTLQQELRDKNQQLNELGRQAQLVKQEAQELREANLAKEKASAMAGTIEAQRHAELKQEQQPNLRSADPAPIQNPVTQVSAGSGAVDLQRYALGSVASGTAELEVDDDIADLTSDLSSVLTPEMQRELAGADTMQTTADARQMSPSASADTLYTPRQTREQATEVTEEGLFSRFNRKKKS